MNIPDTLNGYREYLEKERMLADQTVKAYIKDLRAFHRWINRDVETVTLDDLRAYKRYLSETKAARATIRRKLGGFSTYFKWLTMERVIANAPTDGLVKPPRKRSVPRFLNEEQLNTFVNTQPPIYNFCNQNRDRLAFRLLAWTGVRRGELLNLKVEDVNLTEKVIIVRAGKGGDDRAIPIRDELVVDLQKVIGDRETGYLLTSSYKQQKWGMQSFNMVFRLHIKNCGLVGAGVTPHILRHTFATHLAWAGVDIATIRDLMGHKEIRTTNQYLHSSPGLLRAAIDKHPLAAH